MLSRWIGRLIQEDGANLYRYKGILAIKGVEEKFIFQGVGMLFNGDISDMKWKVPEAERENIFVFIGKNLDHDWLKDVSSNRVADLSVNSSQFIPNSLTLLVLSASKHVSSLMSSASR